MTLINITNPTFEAYLHNSYISLSDISVLLLKVDVARDENGQSHKEKVSKNFRRVYVVCNACHR